MPSSAGRTLSRIHIGKIKVIQQHESGKEGEYGSAQLTTFHCINDA